MEIMEVGSGLRGRELGVEIMKVGSGWRGPLWPLNYLVVTYTIKIFDKLNNNLSCFWRTNI